MQRHRQLRSLISLIIVVAHATACENGRQTGPGTPDSSAKKPVTLKIYPHSVNFADEEFRQIMAEPVKKKFPNITLELMRPMPGSPAPNPPPSLYQEQLKNEVKSASDAVVKNQKDTNTALHELEEKANQIIAGQ